MAIPKIKATYSLDEPTVRKLEEIARRWQTSKSDALSRLINHGAQMSPEQAEVERKLDALRRFQEANRQVAPEEWEKWERERAEISRDPMHAWR